MTDEAESTKLPGKKERPDQGTFEGYDDVFLKSYRHGAVVVGDFFEEATAALMGRRHSHRLTTDSTAWYCPDLRESKRAEYFIESKASGPGGRYFPIPLDQLTAYQQMLEDYFPDMQIADPDWSPSILYAFWLHGVKRIKGTIKFRDELRDVLATTVQGLYVLDLATVFQFSHHKRIEDWSKWGHEEAFRILHSDLKPISNGWQNFLTGLELPPDEYFYTSAVKKGLKVYDRTVSPFPVYTVLNSHSRSKESVQSFILRVLGAGTEI